MAPRTQKPRRELQPDDPTTKRTVTRTLCGWCATSDHEHCRRELLWYEKHYICACSCADEFFAGFDTEKEKAYSSVVGDEPTSPSEGDGA